MKKTLFFLLFSIAVFKLSAQNPTAEKHFTNLSKANDDATRIKYLYKIIYETNSLSQQDRIDYSKKILDLSKKQDNKVMESIATAELGYLLAYNNMGPQGTELAYNALEMGLKHGNKLALGIIYNDLGVCINEPKKSLEHTLKTIAFSEGRDDLNTTYALINAAQYYSMLERKDSAMYYANRDISWHSTRICKWLYLIR